MVKRRSPAGAWRLHRFTSAARHGPLANALRRGSQAIPSDAASILDVLRHRAPARCAGIVEEWRAVGVSRSSPGGSSPAKEMAAVSTSRSAFAGRYAPERPMPSCVAIGLRSSAPRPTISHVVAFRRGLAHRIPRVSAGHRDAAAGAPDAVLPTPLAIGALRRHRSGSRPRSPTSRDRRAARESTSSVDAGREPYCIRGFRLFTLPRLAVRPKSRAGSV